MISIKYKNIYDKFIEKYKEIHIDPWHEINENQLNKIYDKLVNSMNVCDDYSFKYFMDFILKKLNGNCDDHTKFSIMSAIPMSCKIFGDEVIIVYPETLKFSNLLSINGISIKNVMKEIDNILTYGTEGRKKYMTEMALFNKFVLFGLPQFRDSDKLSFEIETKTGDKIYKIIDKNSDEKELSFKLDLNNAEYKFIDNCLIYTHSSVQSEFKEKIDAAISKLQKENLSQIDTIVVDIRGNTGGDSGLNEKLINFLKERTDKSILCLTDYRVFSSGSIALCDLIKFGVKTIGEEIGTPINHFGNNNWINIDGYRFSISGCYFNPIVNYGARSKEQFMKTKSTDILTPYIFKPDVYITQSKNDYINNIDTVLNYALKYSIKDNSNS